MSAAPGWNEIGTGRTVHFGCARIQMRHERRIDGSIERVVLEVAPGQEITVIEPTARWASDTRAIITRALEREGGGRT